MNAITLKAKPILEEMGKPNSGANLVKVLG